ncbi:MAG: hypothetical protein WBP45_01925 [Daejeonella sp.]
MEKIKLFIIINVISILFSCSGQLKKISENRGTIEKLSLDNFKEIPNEIDDCSCAFSETVDRFKKEEYLFVSDLNSIGFLSINNKLIKLRLISAERRSGIFGDNNHKDIYSNEKYKVTVHIKYKRSVGDETWWNYGTITIKSKDGQKLTKKFVGECGC